MNPDNLVAVGVAQIGEINLPCGPLAEPRRILDRRAAIRTAGLVPCRGLLGAAHDKADGAAIGMACRLAVDRLRHHEAPAIMRVGNPPPGVRGGGADAEYTEDRVVKLLRPVEVIAPDHDVTEHSGSPPWRGRLNYQSLVTTIIPSPLPPSSAHTPSGKCAPC